MSIYDGDNGVLLLRRVGDLGPWYALTRKEAGTYKPFEYYVVDLGSETKQDGPYGEVEAAFAALCSKIAPQYANS